MNKEIFTDHDENAPIELLVRAKHYKETDFGDYCDCALSKAAKDQLGAVSVNEGCGNIKIDGKNYGHNRYDFNMFSEDYAKAKADNFSDAVITTIGLFPEVDEEILKTMKTAMYGVVLYSVNRPSDEWEVLFDCYNIFHEEKARMDCGSHYFKVYSFCVKTLKLT